MTRSSNYLAALAAALVLAAASECASKGSCLWEADETSLVQVKHSVSQGSGRAAKPEAEDLDQGASQADAADKLTEARMEVKALQDELRKQKDEKKELQKQKDAITDIAEERAEASAGSNEQILDNGRNEEEADIDMGAGTAMGAYHNHMGAYHNHAHAAHMGAYGAMGGMGGMGGGRCTLRRIAGGQMKCMAVQSLVQEDEDVEEEQPYGGMGDHLGDVQMGYDQSQGGMGGGSNNNNNNNNNAGGGSNNNNNNNNNNAGGGYNGMQGQGMMGHGGEGAPCPCPQGLKHGAATAGMAGHAGKMPTTEDARKAVANCENQARARGSLADVRTFLNACCFEQCSGSRDQRSCQGSCHAYFGLGMAADSMR